MHCPVIALRGVTDPLTKTPDVQAWEQHTTSTLRVHALLGGHLAAQLRTPGSPGSRVVRSADATAHCAEGSFWMVNAVSSSAAATSTTAGPGSATCAWLISLMYGTTPGHPPKFSYPGDFI